MKCRQAVHQFIILLQCLTEAKSWVKYHLTATLLTEVLHLRLQVGNHISHHATGIVGELLHSGRSATHVHQNIRHIKLPHRGSHIGIERATRHIVHNVGTHFLNASARHIGTECVDRNWNVWRHALHPRHATLQTAKFFFGTNVVGTRTSGIGTNVKDVNTFTHHLLHLLFQRIHIKRATC